MSAGSKTRSVAPHGRRADGEAASFPIVGVGASAGGLEAFTQMLQALPTDTGMGFVLVQHLDPDHESVLTQILSRATSLPVSEVKHGEPVLANHVYVIPRDTRLSIAQGVLKLEPRKRSRTPARPIDAFFESLAQDQSERAVGVVLSGTGNDGTMGLEAIKGEGGITIAQDDSAKYDSMPRSAVMAGCVDLVLSPTDIAKDLARIAKHPFVGGKSPARFAQGASDRHRKSHAEVDAGRPEFASSRDDAREVDGYGTVLLLLRSHSGVDFSRYRSSTIQRRIDRRLVLSKQNTLADYAGFLRSNARELDALYSDVLISVTSFFRNPEAFEVLKNRVLPKLLEQRSDAPLRCWVLGCSTGQEAYSIAMTFAEAAEKAPRIRQLQVFATDLNEELLEKARQGLYAKNIADDVTPERLRRFFVEEGGGYRIRKSLREMVVFARQNVIADPPFSRLDLISCRNLLIYLEQSLQKKVLPTFHYALKPNGFLFLGASESISGFSDLFEPIDKKHKIYERKPGPTPSLYLAPKQALGQRRPGRGEPAAPAPRSTFTPEGPEPPEGPQGEINAQREADRITVSQFSPPGVLVNADLQVLQFRGATSAFLEPPIGKASFDVLKMAREGLMLPLRSAINQARKDDKTSVKHNVRVRSNGKSRTVSLKVVPLKNLRERCFLILFDDGAASGAAPERGETKRRAGVAARTAKRERSRERELDEELAQTRDYLQAMQEQHEASTEELQAANEEVQSANEELQSINEELETAKEELESANEELTTVNDEMASRNAELTRLNDDLVNLQGSAKLAIVLIGRELTIRRFSPQAEKQFDLSVGDVGRPVGNIRHNLVVGDDGASFDLGRVAGEVIAEVRDQEHEVRDQFGRWHSLRVRPYLTVDNRVDGATVVLVDIDPIKKSEHAAAVARDEAESIIATVRQPLLVLDQDLRVESANAAFYRTFMTTSEETIGTFLYELGDGQWDIPRLRELLSNVLPRQRAVEDYEVEHRFKQIGPKTMLLSARRMVSRQRGNDRILLAIEDITERKRLETELRQFGADLSDAAVRRDEFLAMLGHELRNPLSALSYGVALLDKVDGDGARAEEVREMLVRQTGHMAALLDQLLDIARVVSGKVEIAQQRVDLADLVRVAIETARPVMEAQKQALTLSRPWDTSLYVRGDPTRLTQIVENLLTNASKYTDEGGRIAVVLGADKGKVRLAVRDTGIGMDAQLLPHIFEVFTQAPRALGRAKGGLGLGLPLVKRLVEMHGGEVSASSPGLGQGSEFVVALPLLQEKRSEERFERQPAASVPRESRHRRILLVDDQEDAAKALADFIQADGHEALAVKDGPAALAAVAAFDPEIVLLDLGLPEMDGYEVARRLREVYPDRKLRLIALTGYQRDEARLKAVGFDDHLLKPPNLPHLSALLAS